MPTSCSCIRSLNFQCISFKFYLRSLYCFKVETGGKPSTWFPPGQLVELFIFVAFFFTAFLFFPCHFSMQDDHFFAIFKKFRIFQFDNIILKQNFSKNPMRIILGSLVIHFNIDFSFFAILSFSNTSK